MLLALRAMVSGNCLLCCGSTKAPREDTQVNGRIGLSLLALV